MDKSIPWLMCGIESYVGIIWPGGKLREYTRHTEILDAVFRGLHVLVYVSVKHTSKTVPGRKQSSMHLLSIEDKHIVVHPNGVQR